MGIKIMVEIQGNLYDMWEVRSIEKCERFNDEKEEMEYCILLNKTAIGLNFAEVYFTYETEEERDAALKALKIKLADYDTILIV